MDVRVTDREELIVVGVRTVLDRRNQDTTVIWRDSFLPRQAELKNAGELVYGVLGGIPGEGDGFCEYVAGAAAASLEGIPEGMVGWLVPAGRYAEISVSGLAGVLPACREFASRWLPSSGFRLSESPIFFCSALASPYDRDAVWEVNLPVEKPGELETLKKWIS